MFSEEQHAKASLKALVEGGERSEQKRRRALGGVKRQVRFQAKPINESSYSHIEYIPFSVHSDPNDPTLVPAKERNECNAPQRTTINRCIPVVGGILSLPFSVIGDTIEWSPGEFPIRSQTIHSIATPSFLAARGYSRTSSSRDECAADSIGASTITVRANSGNSHCNQWLLKLLAKEEGNESYGYSNNNRSLDDAFLRISQKKEAPILLPATMYGYSITSGYKDVSVHLVSLASSWVDLFGFPSQLSEQPKERFPSLLQSVFTSSLMPSYSASSFSVSLSVRSKKSLPFLRSISPLIPFFVFHPP
ncbi:hypothetical protein QL285_098268 [Trifolium repens]|nr:hypothetical protein QL285_098268 [Trifolium repens]